MSLQGEGTLAVGSGRILLSLVESWYEFGLSKLTVYVTNKEPTDMGKLTELCELALSSETEDTLNIIATVADDELNWRAIISPFQFILYVSEHGDLEELRSVQQACIAERKQMLPAIVIRGMGMVGPLLHSDGDGQWESAWLRIHSPVFPEKQTSEISSTAAAGILSNLIVHEWHKAITERHELDYKYQFYLLDPVTLTGSWHSFLPHPLVSGYEAVRPVKNIALSLRTNHEQVSPEVWFTAFNQLTSTVTGIFHAWEEADLIQLPLAQCLVQPADLWSKEPVHLLPTIVRSGLTHIEARRESGLAGLEAYVTSIIPLLFAGLPVQQQEGISIGAGCDVAEAALRGIRACLTKELVKRILSDEPTVVQRIAYPQIEDVRCLYYLQALALLEGEAVIAVGELLLGFPTVWVYSDSSWYGSVDLSITLALRQSLQKALSKRTGVSLVLWKDHEVQDITISDGEALSNSFLMLSAIKTLKQNHKCLKVFELHSESLWGKGPFVAYGVVVREEEAP
jgi:putative thiazole-containing bacteriocin maturation protein